MNTLISTIIISSVLLAVVLETSYSSFFSQANILRSEERAESLALANSCIQVAILHLVEDREYRPATNGDSVAVENDVCKIISISFLSEDTYKIKTSATVEKATTNLEENINLSD